MRGVAARLRTQWPTALSFVVVAVPFLWAVVALAVADVPHLTLPDDLALIDLHTRRALAWSQQLGVFDHNGWNHPGPAEYYVQSLFYRLLGNTPRSLFLGTALVNGFAAVASLAVVRRRTTPTRTLWAALWICALGSVLAIGGAGATTYSESVLGALVSPWNPMVVLFPLLLLLTLCAGALAPSGPSLAGALVVATYVIQTDISAAPLALVMVGVATVGWLARVVSDGREGRKSFRWAPVLVVGALVTVLLAWVPPLVQQVTNHPGNLTLIVRFFDANHPGQTYTAAGWAFAAGASVVVLGPGEIMGSLLGGTPAHSSVAVAVAVATVVLSLVALVVGVQRRSRFGASMGAMVLAGCVAALVALAHVVGFIFGYLVIWTVVLPTGAFIAVGMVSIPPVLQTWLSSRPLWVSLSRVFLGVVATASGAVFLAHVVLIPPLARVSDPEVGRLTDLVRPLLIPGRPVLVGDAGAGSPSTQLLDTERFIGLVNQLDRLDDHPTVNAFWKAQFGPGYLTDGTEPRRITLSTWNQASSTQPGYVGQVGDMAVTVTDGHGRPVVTER